MAESMVVALFRHGITEENKRHAYLGWTDAPLSEDAAETLSLLKLKPYQWLVSSDLQRCVHTAKLLFPGVEPFLIKEFREMSFGRWEGKTYIDLAGDSYYEQWLQNWLTTEIPEGESFQTFSKRIEDGWQKVQKLVIQEHLRRIAIVTHGGVIRYLLSRLGDVEKEFWDWKIEHGTGFELVWENQESFRRGERCILLREAPLTENLPG